MVFDHHDCINEHFKFLMIISFISCSVVNVWVCMSIQNMMCDKTEYIGLHNGMTIFGTFNQFHYEWAAFFCVNQCSDFICLRFFHPRPEIIIKKWVGSL